MTTTRKTKASLFFALTLALGATLGCAKETTCTSDLALCGNQCKALETDPANCGACGQACGAGESCYGGACFCPWTTTCNGACTDLKSDPSNCGACGNACGGATPFCTTDGTGSTACAASCATGQTACGNGDACVDLATHPQNCGACGRSCGTNEQCKTGLCVADLYLACYNTDEIREATLSLAKAGVPIAVRPGPGALSWVGNVLAEASVNGAEIIGGLNFDPPGVRVTTLWKSSAAQPDIEYLATHDGLLYVAHTSARSLLILKPDGAVVDEVAFAASGAPNPEPYGIAFDSNERAWVALNASGEVVVLDVSNAPTCQAPPCTTEVTRLDLTPLASPGAEPMPARIAIVGEHAFVTLWDLAPDFSVPSGSTGRLAAISIGSATSDPDFDATFAGSTNGLIDLGPGCLDPADVAENVDGSMLYVSCGAFDYSNYPAVAIVGAGVSRVDISGSTAQVLSPIAVGENVAPGKLALCSGTFYVGDQNSGNVFMFDPSPATTTLGAGVALCPTNSTTGFAYVPDIACGL